MPAITKAMYDEALDEAISLAAENKVLRERLEATEQDLAEVSQMYLTESERATAILPTPFNFDDWVSETLRKIWGYIW